MVLVALSLVGAIPASAGNRDTQPVVHEWNADGTGGSLADVGWSSLKRDADGLDAVVQIEGLIPGGVYTFWWVVVQGEGSFPDDIHVASGAGAVVPPNGKLTVKLQAATGDPAIEGFMPDGVNEIAFADLNDPLGSLVRVEIAYHGQAADAGDELGQWLYDFWTGDACPPETPNPIITQPHCPVHFASTHHP